MSITNIVSAMLVLLILAACTGPQSIRPAEPELRMPESTTQVDPGQRVQPLSTEEQLRRLSLIKKQSVFDFVLGKGDVLAISVYGEPDLTVKDLPVRVDGRISFQLVGDVQAEGLTVDQLKASLTEKLSEYLHTPKVAVIVQRFASLSYTVAGEVATPGTFPLVTDVTLAQAIAGAGGLKKGQFHATSVELADLTHAFLTRKNEVLPIDFVQLFRNGDMRFDVQLMPGDYIYIPSGLAKEVYILGEVSKPDLFAFSEGFTITDALAQAQGFTEDANLSKIHVVRGSVSNPELFVINMKNVFKGKERDLRLHAGDIVYVPPTGLTSWSRILQRVMPSIQAIQTGLILSSSSSN